MITLHSLTFRNILAHIKKCWDYTSPTGTALEEAFYRGIEPYYDTARKLGSSSTFVDVAHDNVGYDIKGFGNLSHIKGKRKNSNNLENYYNIIDDGKNIFVKIPKSVCTMVRRPDFQFEKNYTDENNLQSMKILNDRILDYDMFARTTATKANCTDLFTFICQYGESKGYKSIFVSIQNYSNPQIDDAVKLQSGSYIGYTNGKISYKLVPFNKSSGNFYKTFTIKSGILLSWPVINGNNNVIQHLSLANLTYIDF